MFTDGAAADEPAAQRGVHFLTTASPAGEEGGRAGEGRGERGRAAMSVRPPHAEPVLPPS